jgi:hypothetical protein
MHLPLPPFYSRPNNLSPETNATGKSQQAQQLSASTGTHYSVATIWNVLRCYYRMPQLLSILSITSISMDKVQKETVILGVIHRR